MAELAAPPPLPVYYMKMKLPLSDARFGKMKAGQIVAMDEATATRYLAAGAAEQTDSGEYEAVNERTARKASARQQAFQQINDAHALWDVSTYRDVLTAPEAGLRMAYERGIPLVNVHMLRDEDGDPLAPDADIEDILDARELLHADLVSPLAAHDRSSVMGGGSPYLSNVQMRQDGPLPLSPEHRAMAQRINAQELYAQIPTARQNLGPGKSERDTRAARRAAGLRSEASSQPQPAQPTAGQPMTDPNVPPPPPPPAQGGDARKAGVVSPDAEAKAKEAGAEKPAKPADPKQIGN